MDWVSISSRSGSRAGRLARLGFAEPARADALLNDPALAGLTDPMDEVFGDGLPDALSQVADPDLALLGLVRLMESLRKTDIDGEDHVGELIASLRHAGLGRDRLLAVLGASAALGDHLVTHPGHWRFVTEATRRSAEQRRDDLVGAVTNALTAASRSSTSARVQPAYDALRVAYRSNLLGIAALDLTAEHAVDELPPTAMALADLAAAALEAALVTARDDVGPASDICRFTVIGMGKCGGRELNYVSDVDVIFVVAPVSGDVADETAALAVGAQLATALMRACSSATAEGTLWPVDAALRPEGKNGPLVRTVASHLQYYQRWAKTWEFQALLKARVVAGDIEVGRAYLDAVSPLVWQAAGRDNFVEDVQAMRRRVEEHVPAAESARQLKLGPGGLRDVEFSVQLLQLVHGRTDISLRSGTTLEALAALSGGGYVAREDAAVLDESYRLLRTFEHRIQLFRLRRTHLMPSAEPDLRRLGRAVGHRSDPAQAVVAQWQQKAREVRRIHERLFYRPLLIAAAKLSSSEARLTPEAARERLAALGFRDPAGAMRHLEAMTGGLSRRASIQRTLLPVMLGWFADEADPDAGLLAFRRISDSLGSSHWYLRMLRDEGSAAERLAHILARSRYAADLLIRAPESVAMLGDVEGLTPRSREALLTTMRAATGRRKTPDDAMTAARVVRRQELFRIAVADLTGQLDVAGVGAALTDLTCATLQSALEIATRRFEEEAGQLIGTRLLVVGMGSLGGVEMGYGSDADVMFVHQPEDGVDEVEAHRQATLVVQEVRRLLGVAGPDPQLTIDTDLRPEGKAGPMVRSLGGFAAYYERWSLPWEAQALLRATPIAGDMDLGREFCDLINPIRWPKGGVSAHAIREIRTLKARMESERLPRGADPKTHFKLGLGGLADVEWTAQLVQLRHGYEIEGLRTTGTLPALVAAERAALISAADVETMAQAWKFASSLRNASVLWRGRPVDALPSDLRDADGIGRIVGRKAGAGDELAEAYRRLARRARTAVNV
ncbi:MAG: [glutamine synthetase] adenylyltransferase / [glutamine synthetase]-adenylyl-L-tyrosine, partial [Actinomycetota bacterium]|nr:[glutamine synthetase] adenylyltransferase / [glutamine synthetase]-adenylyl-L-tyrosine [Actinomycetota bacterium]